MNATNQSLIEDSCYYLTPEYAKSFWGKYIYIYQGKGHLRLTNKELRLEAKKLSLDIPVNEIISIETDEFSWISKPFGLAFIRLHYCQNGQENTIFLIPAKSGFAPVWKTNALIATWIEKMAQIDEISERIKRPLHTLVSKPFFK